MAKEPKLYYKKNGQQVICLTPQKFPKVYNLLAKKWTDIVEKYKAYRNTSYKERPHFPFYVFTDENFAKILKELDTKGGMVTIYYDAPNSRIIEFMSETQFKNNKTLAEEYGFSICA